MLKELKNKRIAAIDENVFKYLLFATININFNGTSSFMDLCGLVVVLLFQ